MSVFQDLDFHFVALTSVDGRLYELDGNNIGPLDLGEARAPLHVTQHVTRYATSRVTLQPGLGINKPIMHHQ